MNFLVCECGLALRVDDSPEAIGSVFTHGEQYACPRPRCTQRMVFTHALESAALPSLRIHDVNAREAFAAVNGLGLPCDKECGQAALAQVFQQKVVKVNSSRIHNSTRTVIHSLEFEDGTIAYFGAAPEGALVYRIAVPHSYTAEVLNER